MKLKSLLSLYLSFLIAGQAIAKEACQPNEYHSQVKVAQVIDGDTVKLESGQFVRLIGIDTPEINHDNLEQSEPLAVAAQAYLKQLIGPDLQVSMVLDKALLDPYNRMLAHLFNHKNENIQQKLVENGYADAHVYGENSLFWQCYYQAEISARQKNKGIWQYPQFQPKAVSGIYKSHSYSYEWQGRLDRVFEKNNTLWLVLANKLYVGITKPDLYQKFKTLNFEALIGQTLYVKTPVYYQDKRWRASLKQPWQLILEEDIKSQQ